MAIISMPQRILVEVAKLTIMIEEEMLARRKNITIYYQEFYSEKLKDFDDEEKCWRKKKEIKYHFETYRKGVYYQNYYNEGHLTK